MMGGYNESAQRCQVTGETCTAVSSVYADIRLPARIQPFVVLGEIKTECCGEPELAVSQPDSENGRTEIIITQSIYIRIPLEYGAKLDTGDFRVQSFNMDQEAVRK